MKRNLIYWPLFAFALSVLGQEPTIDRMPNIVLIMADDLGREAVGCYGGTSYPTPILDGLAQTGVRFDQAYSYPLCTPTRVSLMTGKYNFRNWKAFGILDLEEKTFGHLMQDQGYKTCMVGKWQLQSYDPPGYPGADLRRDQGMKVEAAGFDEYCMWHTGHTEDKGSRYPDPLIYQNGRFLTHTNDKYGPDIFTDYLLDFMTRHRDQPFFAYYPMALTHGPFVMSPDNPAWPDRTKRHHQDNRYFPDMVAYMDKLVGRILDKLDELELRENTLFLFYSDNGTHQSITSRMGDREVRGGKGLNIDDGTRVPMLVEWPGTIPGNQVSTEMVGPIDFIPTLFDAISRKLPHDLFTDGQSFWPAITGQTSQRRDWILIDHNPRPGWDKENLIPARFVRGPQYKLYADGSFYDVQNDALEQHPVAANTTTNLAEIKKRYEGILDSLRQYRTFGEIRSFRPAFDRIVPPHSKIEVIAEGFTWIEGPVWIESEQALLFSDVPRNVIYKWTDTEGVEIFLHPSGYTGPETGSGGKGSNGLTLDQNGKLILCRQGDREVSRLAGSFRRPVPVFEALATHYQGKRINSPNDAVVDSQGNIYFTDPPYGLSPDQLEQPFYGVYRISPKGEIDLLVKDLNRPNGIGLSPDENRLYVANSDPKLWMVYDLSSELPLQGKVLFDGTPLWEKSISRQAPDGLDVNRGGFIFATGPDGVIVLSPAGEHLGTIYTGKNTSNCVLSDDEKVLYVTCDDYLLRVVLGY